MNIGKAVYNIRKKWNIPVSIICKKTGLKDGTYYHVENGGGFHFSTLVLIAQGLGVPVSDIILEAEKYES